MTRETIIQSANEQFMRYGIKSVSMDDIARALGVSKKTIYQFTESKSELVHAVIDWHIEKDRSMMEEMRSASTSAIDAMYKVAQHVVSILEYMNPSVVYDMKKYHRDAYKKMDLFHRVEIAKCIWENIARGREEGFYRYDFDVDVVVGLYIVHVVAITEAEGFPTDRFKSDHLFYEHLKYHFRAICTPKGLNEVSQLAAAYPSIKEQLS